MVAAVVVLWMLNGEMEEEMLLLLLPTSLEYVEGGTARGGEVRIGAGLSCASRSESWMPWFEL